MHWRKRPRKPLKILAIHLLEVVKIYRQSSFTTERSRKMDEQSKLEKSTGYSLPTKTGKESDSAPVEFTESKEGSPVLSDAPSKGGSLISTVEVSASNLLAIQVMMGDFKALKDQLPQSWQTSSKGKIYWCADMPGHKLSVVGGNLLVDGVPVDSWLKKLLAVGK
jgi:hypothetical protein